VPSLGAGSRRCDQFVHVRVPHLSLNATVTVSYGSLDGQTSPTVCALSNGASSSWRPAHGPIQSRLCAQNRWSLDSPYRGHRRRMFVTFIAPRVALSQNCCFKSRTVPHSVEGIQHGLSWAGLDYDFGMFSLVTSLLQLAKQHTRCLLKDRVGMALMDLTSRYVCQTVAPLRT
jgi:hypothetical protein